MIKFTIFHNERIGAYAAVYDFNLPTMTGIGTTEEWRPVYHGEATGLLDKARQCKAFAQRAQNGGEAE